VFFAKIVVFRRKAKEMIGERSLNLSKGCSCSAVISSEVEKSVIIVILDLQFPPFWACPEIFPNPIMQKRLPVSRNVKYPPSKRWVYDVSVPGRPISL